MNPNNHPRSMLRILAVMTVLALIPWLDGLAQGEPEAPKPPEILRNGWQFSFFGGVSYNVFGGGYYGDCPCTFLANSTSGNLPAGASLSIPLFEDASLYIRAGMQNTSTTFFSGRIDSLLSMPGIGDIGDELQFDYSLLHFDLLLRLFGRIDGERIFVGPSFGIVGRQQVRVTATELSTGKSYLIEDRAIEGGKSLRTSLVIGAEYAFIPWKHLYIIPSLQVDYSPQRISDLQPLRPVFYKFLVNIEYQLF